MKPRANTAKEYDKFTSSTLDDAMANVAAHKSDDSSTNRATARCMEAMLPVMHDWLKDEWVNKKSDPGQAVIAAVNTYMSCIFSVSASICGGREKHIGALPLVEKLIQNVITSHRRDLGIDGKSDDSPDFNVRRETDEYADQLLAVHDLSMSKDPALASQGRLQKLILPLLADWIEQEFKDRDVTPGDIMFSSIAGAISIIGSTIGSFALNQKELDHNLDLVSSKLMDSWEEAREQISEQRFAGESNN
jgi:hypothetical protein